MKTQSLRHSLLQSAMNILAIREHSEYELKIKLQKKIFASAIYSDTDIEQLLSDLKTDDLLSDERFTEVFIRSRMNKGFGPVKIVYELKARGVAKHIIENNMQCYSDRDKKIWFDSIEKAWHKKFSATTEINKVKQSRYLYQRGFSFNQIESFLKTRKTDKKNP